MAIIRVDGFARNLQALAWISERGCDVKYSHDIIYEWHFGNENKGDPYGQYREFMFADDDVNAIEFALRFG